MHQASAQSDFRRRLNGRLHGLLRWPQWDRICRYLGRSGAWYVYDLERPPPRQPLRGEALVRALAEVDSVLRREHPEDYCGLAYADDLEAPTLVKIYHPQRMGKVCGSSGEPIPPAWIVSLWPPEDLGPAAPQPAPSAGWRRWLGRL